MGIIVNKENDKNTDLSRRIDTDLRERLQSTNRTDPDLAEDSDYVKDFNKTNKFGWVWPVLIVLALISLVFILFF